MISTPLLNLSSAMQQRPHSGSAAIVVQFKFKGESVLPIGKAPVITGTMNTIAKWFLLGLLLDRSIQGGRCRHNPAPT
jgi:hypothetical protein